MIPKIEVLTLKNLSPGVLENFSKLQAPYTQSSPNPVDLFDPQNRLTYAIGASIDGVPAGLLLMDLSGKIKAADMKSLFIAEPYRRQGIGSQMVAFAVDQLKSVNFRYIFAVYPDGREDTAMLEAFLQKNGFLGKQKAEVEFVFKYSDFKPAWFTRHYHWNDKCQVFPWTELTYFEAVLLKEQCRQGLIPAAVNPFHGSGAFEPLNSLGLRYEGRIVGWMVTDRVSPTVINYKNLYIDYEFQKKGYAIQLLVDALNIHYRHQIKWGMFKLNVLQASSQWLKFIRRRLAPHADYIFEYNQASRQI